ncbi:hypothetical protein niasHT_008016 [Heterodera trifolii]|uniref:NTR domain-containing protein n=1 Tax=Heterodera trifolii TaxID=157864 RepID=A0ABD2LZU5_9BILA
MQQIPILSLSNFLPIFSLILVPFLLSFPSTAFGCSCAPTKFNESMCVAKWVSHVKVLQNTTTTNSHRIFTVRHLEVFKSPNGTAHNDQMIGKESAVWTPIFTAACGVKELDTEKEYLLAGTVDNSGTMQINLCLFIPIEDGQPNAENGIVEWAKVPEGTKARMANWDDEQCP